MRLILGSILAAAVFLAQTPAMAANPAQVAQLERTKQCPRCDLSGSDLTNINLDGANLSGANLVGAQLYQCKRCNLSNATLVRADLRRSNLTGATLRNANLRGAQLSESALNRANLTGANLRGTDLLAGDLEFSVLCRTTMPDGAQSNRNCTRQSSAPPPATPRNLGALVNCRIESNGRVEFNRKCRFKLGGRGEGAGSFSLSDRTGQGMLYADIMVVTVSVTSPGVAEVFGLTRHGNNSRWGTARRSNRNRACWDGPDFRICAWK